MQGGNISVAGFLCRIKFFCFSYEIIIISVRLSTTVVLLIMGDRYNIVLLLMDDNNDR